MGVMSLRCHISVLQFSGCSFLTCMCTCMDFDQSQMSFDGKRWNAVFLSLEALDVLNCLSFVYIYGTIITYYAHTHTDQTTHDHVMV